MSDQFEEFMKALEEAAMEQDEDWFALVCDESMESFDDYDYLEEIS